MTGSRLNVVIALLAAAALPDSASAAVLIGDCCGGIEQYILNPDTISATGPSVVSFGTAEGPCCYIEAGFTHSMPLPVASSSKWVSAYIILTLVEEGLLALDTRVADLFDWWTSDPADRRSEITVHNLLTQTDGMGTYEAGLSACAAATVLACAQEAYEFAFTPAAYRQYPGTGQPAEGEEAFYYSETGWFTLGAVALHVTGLPTYDDVFHAKLGNRLGISANCSFMYPTYASALPGGGLSCSNDDYQRFIMAVFAKTIVSEELVDFAEMPATMLYGIQNDSWRPEMVWAEYLYYGHGFWVECAARGCTGAPKKVSSMGVFGNYPYIWRNGTESHWGIHTHFHQGQGDPANTPLDNPMWGYNRTKVQFRHTFPTVKRTIAAMNGEAPQPPVVPVVGSMYTSVGGVGVVVEDEGATVGAFKEDCTADPLDTCFRMTPDLGFCEQQCTSSAACNSFTFCGGNTAAPFPRCYLKTKHIDFAVKPHGGGDCTTYLASGLPLGPRLGTVARNEGSQLASIKGDCDDNELDFCFRDNYTFYDCGEACEHQDGCESFAYCTGIGHPSTELRRCYLKTASFETVTHAGGDCTSFYPSRSASCRHVKNYHVEQGCCGAPMRELDMNVARPQGVQQF